MSATDDAESTYLIDVEEGAETSRLLEQNMLYNRAQGGLFPTELDLTPIQSVLDIGCGPGGWALEVAYTYKHLGVVGIDINSAMIRYAFAQARTRKLQNVSFEVMDASQPLDFPDASFDLINTRFVASFLTRATWPDLLKECMRLLKPGGILQLTEVELGITNSAALERLSGYIYQSLYEQKRNFSVNGRSIGIVHMLGQLLKQAGYTNICRKSFFMDSSFGAELHYSTIKDIELLYPLIKPYLVKSNVVDEAVFDEDYKTMGTDVMRHDFVALSFGLIAWGHKPLS
ncbi:hypothetical protein KDA_64590 [Dictyobacter alpinus]|uniref:Methyltransferase domain-containing protein n=1 Tax=Dictyobacter alpinus TaxID=2014873 RepID=A0A402BHZ1_9CHLR|nr:class I SAM-dependent methyltransferase [Dictyobacter alpinus]GCE30975.1 hypothetical protein KDA_64590 [Dictyobacter alpinus]